jgi:CRP/FNR family transcriptional regulator, anaerobic regulatory protein
MPDQELIKRWFAALPSLPQLEPEHRKEMLDHIQFNRLHEGNVAYHQGQQCQVTDKALKSASK